ncbi:hypothetical protein MKJ01_05270 [Chryseobacterium sp. SSA4.19]|uniref:hypothetical protein n=1 Tax=Chryseobacterium sp. SSA4.19 TaxID=2919915 RepID=UPI001F4DE757|nr:hypothetical protein [Chryseobacterium sp. SSA4.19]MCJ8153170.1 hypothetical protein [Chryseobacterium sp. SSA4.19]
MFHKTIIYSLGIWSLINCSTRNKSEIDHKVPATAEVKANTSMKDKQIIYFNEGENRFLKDYQMNVTFKGISEDSRCPKDVNCIWAGAAVAQVEVMGTATRPMTLSLATTDNKGRNYSTSAEFNGYTITLAEVNPYPTAAEGSKALNGKYRIGIMISKAGESSTRK